MREVFGWGVGSGSQAAVEEEVRMWEVEEGGVWRGFEEIRGFPKCFSGWRWWPVARLRRYKEYLDFFKIK